MEATQEYSALILSLSQNALAARSVPEAVTPILRSLVNETSAVGAGYFQATGDLLKSRATAGRVPEREVFQDFGTEELFERSPLITALQCANEPILVEDTAADVRGDAFHACGVSSIAAAPVIDQRGDFVGAFIMHTFERHQWTDGERALFASVAGVLSSLAARLVAEEKALSAQEGAIRALGLALEYRDRETKGHTDRVTALSGSIARALDLEERDRNEIRWGAYLHDIGKISIPDTILLKPAKLDDSEWSVMKTHPTAGFEFARALGFLPERALDVVLYHHERWDGKGYPYGLAGEDIPLSGRIFAVADVFDALVSTRPYKRAWVLDEARTEIEAQAGKHFDPAVVEAFMRSQRGRN